MRKLASVQRIRDISPIEGADRIELAHVLGWQCVVNKGVFQPGEMCVYFEVDSFLPLRPEFDFLRASSYTRSDLLGEGFRLKTMRMRGEISQGLCLPVSAFPELEGEEEGKDVTEALGVRKWEIPEMATTVGTVVSRLPDFIQHTDETRIQNMPDVIAEFGTRPYYISTKMDGSSHSIGIGEDGEFYVTGHNYVYKDDGKCSFYEFVKQHGFEEKLRRYYDAAHLSSVCIQGEYCGPGIQKNRLKLVKPNWYVFTVMLNGKRENLAHAMALALLIGADFVPIEEVDTSLPDHYQDVESLLKRAEGEYRNGGAKEGIVVRPLDPVYSEALHGPLSIKVINNRYLLKNE